jgi:hypothetical protein
MVARIAALACGLWFAGTSALAVKVQAATVALPAVAEEGVSDVSSSGAQFNAQVNPGGLDTTFQFEYGTSAAYGQSVPVPVGDLGAGGSDEPVSIQAQNLLPQTTYHVRLVTTNALGTVDGPDETFTTQAAGGELNLPDGRQWEMVSPPAKYGASIDPFYGGVVEASEDGSAITYVANGPFVANPAGNPSPLTQTQVLSRRAGGSWSTEDLATPTQSAGGSRHGTEYLAFSSDLSQALVEPGSEMPLSPEATERTLYLRDDNSGSYTPLVTPTDVSPAGTKFAGGELLGVSGTPDLSHVLLTSQEPLISGAPNGATYEWTAGKLALVSVLPEGQDTFGRPGAGSEDLRHAISNDGSRVFWSPSAGALRPGPLYMRDTVTGQTVQVDAPEAGVSQPLEPAARFQIASATGSKVFFTDAVRLTTDSTQEPPLPGDGDFELPPDLYVYDTEAKTLSDLTVDHNGGEQADVQGLVLGTGEDGSIVYFVATGALTSEAEAGKDNLYVESETGSTWSAPRLVAVLSAEDAVTWGVSGTLGGLTPANLAATVSPSGRFLAFMSDRSLTGYNNRDAVSGQPDEEVFLYDEATGRLACASCDPTGARPTGVYEQTSEEDAAEGKEGSQIVAERPLFDRLGIWTGDWIAAGIPAWDLVTFSGLNDLASYQSRYLTDEGRLFFNSFDSLAAQATDGKADVYEYEPPGVGDCTSSGATFSEMSGGCVSLISAGTSGEESAFLDASGMGPGGEEAENVFFMTTSRLVSQDVDSSYDVYDAHVCSSAVPCVTAPVSPPECASGDSCKAAPSLQPAIFGAPASATFSGTGNVASAPAIGVTPKKSAGKGKKSAKHKKQRKRLSKRKVTRSRARGGSSVGAGARKGRGR